VISGLSSFRSRLPLVALVLLPALVYRALIPAGFMPLRDAEGRLAIVFCPGVSAGAVAPPHHHQHNGHHHHDGTPDAGGINHAAHEQNVCPYALSAGAALAYAVPVHAALFASPQSAEVSNYPSIVSATITRSQSARAPPVPHRV